MAAIVGTTRGDECLHVYTCHESMQDNSRNMECDSSASLCASVSSGFAGAHSCVAFEIDAWGMV